MAVVNQQTSTLTVEFGGSIENKDGATITISSNINATQAITAENGAGSLKNAGLLKVNAKNPMIIDMQYENTGNGILNNLSGSKLKIGKTTQMGGGHIDNGAGMTLPSWTQCPNWR